MALRLNDTRRLLDDLVNIVDATLAAQNIIKKDSVRTPGFNLGHAGDKSDRALCPRFCGNRFGHLPEFAAQIVFPAGQDKCGMIARTLSELYGYDTFIGLEINDVPCVNLFQNGKQRRHVN